MKKKNKYYSDKVVRQLNRKNDCFIIGRVIFLLVDQIYITKKEKWITNPDKKFDLGNKSWGKIDFLINEHEFKISKLASLKHLKK